MDTYIIDGVRSPIGIKNGQMMGVRPDDLAADIIKVLLERNSNIDHKYIEIIPYMTLLLVIILILKIIINILIKFKFKNFI